MIDINDAGKLMHLPISDLEIGYSIQISSFVVSAAAEYLMKAEGHNWVPVIVRQIGKYRYEVIENGFILKVAEQAGFERVWCIVTNSQSETIELVQILSGNKLPRVSLSNASRELIMEGLKYLIERPVNPLKGVDLHVATNKIYESRRDLWTDLSPISKLKCKITANKIKLLNEIFYLSPPIELPPPPVPVNIKEASTDEIIFRLEYLSENRIDNFQDIDVQSVVNAISIVDKGKWKTLNPIVKLDCGIEKTHIKALKTVFLI